MRGVVGLDATSEAPFKGCGAAARTPERGKSAPGALVTKWRDNAGGRSDL